MCLSSLTAFQSHAELKGSPMYDVLSHLMLYVYALHFIYQRITHIYFFNLNLDQIITGRILIILFSLISLCLGTLKSTNSSKSVLHLIGDLNLDPGNAILNFSVAFLESDHIEALS